MSSECLPEPVSWKERRGAVNVLFGGVLWGLVAVSIWSLDSIGAMSISLAVAIVLLVGVGPTATLLFRKEPESLDYIRREARVVKRLRRDRLGLVGVGRALWDARSIENDEVEEGVIVEIVAKRAVVVYVRRRE